MSIPRYLQAECGVRYWEDATVDGVEDEDGSRIPCRRNDTWAPLIDLDGGLILDWPAGTEASIHYKVCDDGRYRLLDAERLVLRDIEGYVPAILSPGGSGYGDYVIMDVWPDGKIKDFVRTLDEFS